MGQHGACRQNGTCTHVVARDHRCATADHGVVTNRHGLPLGSVAGRWKFIVENDGTWPNEHPVSQHRRIGDVGTPLHFAASAHGDVLTDVGKRTDGAPLAERAVVADVAGPPRSRTPFEVDALTCKRSVTHALKPPRVHATTCQRDPLP